MTNNIHFNTIYTHVKVYILTQNDSLKMTFEG